MNSKTTKTTYYKIKIRLVFLILAILLMCAIFYFSSRNAEQSTQQSFAIGEIIGKTFVPGFESWSRQDQLIFMENADFTVRKSAHATEYMLLAILWILAFKPTNPKYKRYLAGFIITVLYAMTDEIHQVFVPGRAGMVRDVLIDSCGAAVGVILVILFSKLKKAFLDNHKRQL